MSSVKLHKLFLVVNTSNLCVGLVNLAIRGSDHIRTEIFRACPGEALVQGDDMVSYMTIASCD